MAGRRESNKGPEGIDYTNLEPEGSSLADSGQLSGLEVGESKRRQSLVLLGEVGKSGDDNRELVKEKGQTISEEDQVGVAARVMIDVGQVDPERKRN